MNTRYNSKQKLLSGGALSTGQNRIDGQRYAVFAMLSYLKGDAEKLDYLKKYGKTGWLIDPVFTNDDITVLHKNETGETVISIAGTRWDKTSDVIADAYILVGNSENSEKAKYMIDTVGKIVQKYGQEKTIITGHSLGGELSRLCANKYGLKAYIFNRATGLSTPFQTVNKNINEYSTNYNGNRDIVSWLGSLFPNKHNTSEFNPIVKSVHSLDNFIPQNQAEIAMTGTGRRRSKFHQRQ